MRLPLIGTAPHPIAHALHPEGISNDEYDGSVSADSSFILLN